MAGEGKREMDGGSQRRRRMGGLTGVHELEVKVFLNLILKSGYCLNGENFLTNVVEGSQKLCEVTLCPEVGSQNHVMGLFLILLYLCMFYDSQTLLLC